VINLQWKFHLKPQRGMNVGMPKTPSESRPYKKPARPPATERFISYQSDIRIIKKGGRIFVAEVTTKISELKRNNNVIEIPFKRVQGDDQRRGG